MRSNEGQVLDFASMQQGQLWLNNQGVMQSAQQDAIRTGDVSQISIENSGTISSQGLGRRGIDITGNGGERVIAINNSANGSISSENDSIRVNYNLTAGSLVLNNAGTIASTGLGDNAGQAIDFNSVTGSGVQAIIQNAAGGVIKSADADAVRPGGNGILTNAGIIQAGGAGLVDGANSTSADGIDFQEYAGTVLNQSGGVIEAARHEITGSGFIDVINEAGAEIVGRNGSGINLDGNGRVVNYGIISGQYNSQLAEGDGDGVDIDFIGDIENFGRIEGIGAAGIKNGDPNRADGIAMGGGRIINHGGATIYSSDRGILVDNSDGGAAFSATYIANSGTIDAQNEGGSFGSVNQFQQWQVQQGSWQMAADLLLASEHSMQITSDAQLQVQGNAMLEGELLINLFSNSLLPLFDVEQELLFGEQFMLTLDLNNNLVQPGNSWQLFSASSLINFDSSKLSIIGLAQLPAYELFSNWDNSRYQVSFRFLPNADVSAPASLALLGVGMLGLRLNRRRTKVFV